MTDYKPPGYISFTELFEYLQNNNEETVIKLEKLIKKDRFKLENAITEIDQSSHSEVEEILYDKESFQPFDCTFIFTVVDNLGNIISRTIKVYCFSAMENNNNLICKVLGSDRTIVFDIIEVQKLLKFSKLLLEIRDALCEEKINGYYVDGFHYIKAYPQVWLKENCWYSIIATNNMLQRELTDVNLLFYSPSNDKQVAIYFKLEEISKLFHKPASASSPNFRNDSDQPNFTFYLKTPWIELMSQFSKKYEEIIYSISKDSIIEEMLEYIKRENLDIPVSDVPYLAKFIRHPDQRKGKAYVKPTD